MTDLLARLRVKETHGIRRFLYPLFIYLPLAENTNELLLSLSTPDGQPIPTQATQCGLGRYRIDFAVSLSPYQEQELLLTLTKRPTTVDDAIDFQLPDGRQPPSYSAYLQSRQRRFSLSLDESNGISEVVYDGVSHLRGRSTVLRNGEAMAQSSGSLRQGQNLLTAWYKVRGSYETSAPWDASTRTVLTACKSWATVIHKLFAPKPQDEVAFTLPFAVTAPTLTCDFGVGNGIYGKLQAGTAEEMTWQTQFGKGPHAQWSLATAGRVDYIGIVATAQDFLPQRWFHLIDSNKALAVALTDIPDACREMTVTLNIQGDVTITFRLGERVTEAVTFGVCYHFLNDVPAIAAATNPQSILLPPTVEVLPI